MVIFNNNSYDCNSSCEPMEDAFLDVSNYGIMATIVKNDKWGK